VSTAALESTAELVAGEATRRVSVRARMRLWALVADVVAAIVSYEIAMVVFSWFHHEQLHFATQALDWGIPVGFVAILVSFTYCGLYKLEAWVSRPLHVFLLLKGTLIALVITAALAFTFRAPIVTDSRLTVFTAFADFFALAFAARVWLLDRLYRRDVAERLGHTLVIGVSADSGVLVSRLKELRGYARVRALEPRDRRRNGYDAEPALLRAVAEAEPAPRQVFIDGASVGYKATFDLIAAARARGSEVYISGRLVSRLDTTRLLLRLFELPVMRVSHEPAWGRGATATGAPRSSGAAAVERAFDVVASAAALVLLSPLFAAIALAIRRDSPGPVFFRQQRVGLHGRPFEFLKFRTMKVDSDDSAHQAYVCRLIERGEMACVDENGAAVYKLTDDERVTRVGRFLRKWSLDELPQFINVLRGDMSMVGPRPALDYEVAAYHDWHRRRLRVKPGVSGLWQIAGRSRVGFDEMVFQDVIYGYNQSLLTDVSICLRTVPAVIMGRGGA
jgi:exopolysaccharide biosynthesis polyprenyl glycosylphosphotransferase